MKRKTLWGTLAAAALLGVTGSPASAAYFSAPFGSTPGNYNIYQMITTRMTWDQARVDAASRTFNGVPGHLVTLTSLAENNAVQANAPGGWWIGLTDSDVASSLDGANHGTLFGASEAGSNPNGNWRWVTGEPFSFQNFSAGEPNDSGGEDAAELRGDNLWNDNEAGGSLGQNNRGAETINRYLVEYETNLASPPPASTSQWLIKTYKNTQAFGPDVNNLATADSVMAGNGLAPGFPISGQFGFTDTLDSGGGANFGIDQKPPGLVAPDNDHFVVKGTGAVTVDTAGNYTFRTNTDDGSRLRISVNGAPMQQVITDDVLSGPHDVSSAPVALNAGDQVAVEWTWYESGVGGEGELAYSNDGSTFTLFGDNSLGLTNNSDFTLTTYKSYKGIQQLAIAEGTAANPSNLIGQTTSPTFNTTQTGGDGFFIGGIQVPGLDGAVDTEDFTVVGTGMLEVTTEGDYKFGSLSDDGARLRIDGVDVISDDTLHGANFDVDLKTGTAHLTPGLHSIEYMWFERGGGASGELMLLDANNVPIALVGDEFFGGLRVVQQVPEPSTIVLGSFGLLGLAALIRRRRGK